MKRRTLIAVGVSAAIVLALGGGLAYSAANNRPLVSVATATTQKLDVSISASGKLVPARTAGVFAPTGTLASVSVRDGQSVTAGQVLARLNTAPLKLAVAQARATYAQAQAQSETVANAAPSASERSAAASTLSAARSAANAAARNYADYLNAYNAADSATRATMLSTLRTLHGTKDTTAAAVKTAGAAIDRLNRSGRVSRARAAASASVSAAGQALRQAEQDLSNATVIAPFAGTVSVPATIEPGAAVVAGVAVLTVTDPKVMEFEAAVNETDIAQVVNGQAATVSLDAFADPFTGTVSSVQSSPQQTGTGGIAFGVRIPVAAGSSRLFAGMSGSADIITASIPDALVIPVESVVSKGNAKTVFVVDANGIAHAKPVTLGASTDTVTQIRSGLAAGDRVATTGASALTDGQQARVQ